MSETIVQTATAEDLAEMMKGSDADLSMYKKPADKEGWYVTISPMMFGDARILITDGQFNEDGWCYSSHAKAIRAFNEWDGKTGEPKGWHRNPFDGREVEGEYERP